MNEADKKNVIKTARKELKAFYEMNTDAEFCGTKSGAYYERVFKAEDTLKARSPLAICVAVHVSRLIGDVQNCIGIEHELYLKTRENISNSIFDALEKAV